MEMRKIEGKKVWIAPAFFVLSFLVILGSVLVFDYCHAFSEARNTLAQELSDVKTILTYRLEYDRHFLQMLAEQMSDGYLTEQTFRNNVSRYVCNRVYLVNIIWSKPGRVIAWKEPDPAWNASRPEHVEAEQIAYKTHAPAYSRPFQNRADEFLFEINIPVFQKNSFLGMFTGIYSSENLIKFIHVRKHLKDQYLIRLIDKDERILAERGPSVPLDLRLTKQLALDPPGRGVELVLIGRKIGLSHWQLVMLISGSAILALGMGWSMWAMNREVLRRIRVEEALVRDMAERRKAEERLRQSQAELAHAWRVATVGEMAGSLAHELNQPLCSITTCADTCAEILKKKGPETPEILSGLEEIGAQAERAGYIIRHIKEFVRKSEPKRSRADLNDIVRKVLSLVSPEMNRRGIVLEMNLTEPLPPVRVDVIQIEQVILNLLQNAIDAMIEKDTSDRKLVIRTALEPENKVSVLVKDTGRGLSAEAQAHLFEPFFTTKPQGLGMGLSISRSIIENHGGKLSASSDPGRGTTFQFTLSTLTDK